MKRRQITWFTVLVLVLELLTGCGSKAEMGAGSTASSAEAPMEMVAYAEETATDYGVSASTASADTADAASGVKRIYTASMELETTGFDDAVKGLTALMEESGGWFESSSLGSRGSGYRYANYTVRVPVERYRSFLDQAGELCHLLYSDEYVEDVSEAYYDTQGRLKTQQIKLERLQSLLARAEAMEDIITIESAISETEQRIDDLSGTLQHYDARVSYSTIHITLREVARLSNVEEPVTGFGAQLTAALASGWKNFVSSLQDLAIDLAYGWMWVLILVVVVVVLVRRLRRKKIRVSLPKLKKKQDEQEPRE